jgi:hypothetical protein
MKRVDPLRSSTFRLGSDAATRVSCSRSEFFWKSCEMRRALSVGVDSVPDERRLPASSERRSIDAESASLSMLCHRRRAAEAPLS